MDYKNICDPKQIQLNGRHIKIKDVVKFLFIRIDNYEIVNMSSYFWRTLLGVPVIIIIIIYFRRIIHIVMLCM